MSIPKHASYNLIGSLVPLVISLVTVPLYLQVIGLERYGVLALCLTFLGFMGFLNLGLGPSIAQMMARLRKADSTERESVFWTGLWVSLTMGVVAGLLVYGAADIYFKRMEDLPRGLSSEVADAKVWLAAILPAVMLSSVLTGTLQGHERFLAINVVTSVTSVLMAIAPLAVAYAFGPHLADLLAAALGARIASLLGLLPLCLRTIPIRHLRWPDPSLVKSLLTFGGWLTADSVIASLLVTFDRFFIGVFLGAAAVSIYTIPYNLVSRIQLIPGALGDVLFPRFASMTDPDRSDWLELESIAAIAAIMTPIIVVSMLIVEPFLILWIGPSLALQSSPVAFLILFALWANSIARVPYSRLLAAGKPALITKIHLLETPAYLGLLALGTLKFGVAGAAAAWCLRTTADALVFVALMPNRKLVFKRLIIPSLLSAASLAIVYLLPLESTLRWLFMSAALLAAVFWSFRTMPSPLRAWVHRILKPIPILRHIPVVANDRGGCR